MPLSASDPRRRPAIAGTLLAAGFAIIFDAVKSAFLQR